MKYDFVLFECFYTSINHLKDLCAIARMLKDNGYSVAIADVFHESQYCQVEGVPHIQIKSKCRASLVYSQSKWSFVRVLYMNWNKFLIDLYLMDVINELKSVSKHFYAGTMQMWMPVLWIKRIPNDCLCFFWGLRSYHLCFYKNKRLKEETWATWYLNKRLNSQKNIKLFVSDDIIKQEYVNLGIDINRLVLRPERTIDEYSPVKMKKPNNKVRFLIIGSLRGSKRVDLIIDAYKEIKNTQCELIIAGKASEDKGFNKRVGFWTNNVPGLVRIDKRLSDEEYNQLIIDCDYLILCDEQDFSCATNGTMNDALLMGRPIIAPNYNPYRNIIEEHHVGMLYNLYSKDSIKNVFEHASTNETNSYVSSIHSYQKHFLYRTVMKDFGNQIRKQTQEYN